MAPIIMVHLRNNLYFSSTSHFISNALIPLSSRSPSPFNWISSSVRAYMINNLLVFPMTA